MNFADKIGIWADSKPNSTAVVLPDHTVTFSQLDDMVWKTATHLYRQEFRQGDIIALSYRDELALLVATLACARIGATSLTVPPDYPITQQLSMLSSARANFLIYDNQPPKIDLEGIAFFPLSRSAVLELQDINVEVRDARPTALCIINYGSGTTGRAKLIPYTHEFLEQRCSRSSRGYEVTESDCVATQIHLNYWSAKVRLLAALGSGNRIALVNDSGKDPISTVIDYGVTVLTSTVFHIEQICQALPEQSTPVWDHLNCLDLTSSTVSESLRRRITQSVSRNLYVSYGCNECGNISVATPDEIFTYPGTVGRLLAETHLEIVDSSDLPIAAGTPGLIRVKTPSLAGQYLADQEATSAAYREGWFYPGDLGLITEDNQLVYLGRTDDMMIMNGINIYPTEIEHVLTGCPGVAGAAALAIRNEVSQDIPVCAVTLESTARTSEYHLLNYAREQLGAHSPRRIVILQNIPRNELGKPLRDELAHQVRVELGLAPNFYRRKVESALASPSPARQPWQVTQQMVLVYKPPEVADLERLDPWLVDVLEDAHSREPGYELTADSKLPAESHQWLMRCMRLATLFMQAAHVPIFCTPEIVECLQDDVTKGTWRVKAAVVYLENFPPDAFGIALKGAFASAAWAVRHDITTKNRQELFIFVQNNVIDPLLKGCHVGKCTYEILKSAHLQCIPFRHFGTGVYQLGWGANARLSHTSSVEQDSGISKFLATSKSITANVLYSAGLPAAANYITDNQAAAINAGKKLSWPVVVKPDDADRGEGVTVDVVDEKTLTRAFHRAIQVSIHGRVVIEQQVPGVCVRLFIAGGGLLYAVKRMPMSVQGNGTDTVADLVSREYEFQQSRPPWKRTEISSMDAMARESIKTAGFNEMSVPDEGVWVPLRRIESTEWGGIDEDVSDRVHPENLRVALAATSLLGMSVAGVDIITTDIGRPWYENGAIINEVNSGPMLGGGEISRQNLPLFLNSYLNGDGRIPIEIYIGGEAAWQSATERWKALLARGANAYLTSAKETLMPSGLQMPLPFENLYRRVHALLLSKSVEAIVMVLQTDEFLHGGVPVEWVDRVYKVDQELTSFTSPDEALTDAQLASLNMLLDRWQVPMVAPG